MELTDAQRGAITNWVDEGCGLSEIQRRLDSELGISLTYMDVRFLVIDLGLTLQEDSPPPSPEPSAADPAGPGTPAPPAPPTPDAPLGGGVDVSVDRVVKPGAVASGSVTFRDGTAATWMLDQLGRLALDAGDPAYRPSQEDIRDFQDALRETLQKQGY